MWTHIMLGFAATSVIYFGWLWMATCEHCRACGCAILPWQRKDKSQYAVHRRCGVAYACGYHQGRYDAQKAAQFDVDTAVSIYRNAIFGANRPSEQDDFGKFMRSIGAEE